MRPSTALARAVLGELVAGGIAELVLCPGSRSAPLAFAAARLADAGALSLHVRIDERSAGFLALGLAKVSGRPVAVACTSGTAVANLMPAVVEASYAAVPLVVLSADRPIEARGVAAPQTIDQIEIFGATVRYFADLGESLDPAEAVEHARTQVRLALDAAHGFGAPGPVLAHVGPVHLNVGLRLPLVPGPDEAGDAAVPGTGAQQVDASNPAIPRVAAAGLQSNRGVSETSPTGAGKVIAQPPHGLILVGDLPGPAGDPTHAALVALARGNGWPIIAEPSANLHGQDNVLGHGVLALGTAWLDGHLPDLVVTIGAFGLSRPTLNVLRRARSHLAVELSGVGREVCDPVRTATRVLSAIPVPALGAHDPQWLAGWLDADRVAAGVVAGALDARGGGDATYQAAGRPSVSTEPLPTRQVSTEHLPTHSAPPSGVTPSALRGDLTGAAVAREVFRSAAHDGLLLVAASWPVRHVEAFGGSRRGLRVIGNRGANGIDGLISTAWGAALAHQRLGHGRGLALLGDLAFLHDHNGLLAGPSEERPDLTIVVIDNDGGGIFSQLEQGRPEYAADFDRLFATAQGRDLVAVATAAGVPSMRVRSRPALREALGLREPGLRVVVAEVPGFAGDLALMGDVESCLAARLSPG